jgi:hypothetical protein
VGSLRKVSCLPDFLYKHIQQKQEDNTVLSSVRYKQQQRSYQRARSQRVLADKKEPI